MLLQAMQEYANDEAIVIPESQEESQKASNKKDNFYKFIFDDESSSQNSSIEQEYLPKELSASTNTQP